MRLHQRGRIPIRCRGVEIQAAVRPLSGALTAHRYGQYVQDMLRLLLPYNALMAPGDRVEIADTPYVCVFTRTLHGHMQADLRRCSR